jgi:hypothetical protein
MKMLHVLLERRSELATANMKTHISDGPLAKVGHDVEIDGVRWTIRSILGASDDVTFIGRTDGSPRT